MKQLIILLALALVVQIATAQTVNKENCKVEICKSAKQDVHTNLQCADIESKVQSEIKNSSFPDCPPECDIQNCELTKCEMIPDCIPEKCSAK